MPHTQTIRMNGESVYLFDHYLDSGEYMFLINAPFDTRMLVSPVNPVPGLRFVDQDPTPNIFNANLTIPQTGQYGFKVTLDREANNGSLEVKFIRQGTGGGSGGNGSTTTKLWNRADVQDFITAYLSSKRLNKWGYPDTPGVKQGTPPAYHSGRWENTFHWVYEGSAAVRDAVRQRFPQYS